jgi:N-acyl-D-amino-acid deacylase
MKSVSRNLRNALLLGCTAALLAGTAQGQSAAPEYDIVIRGGHVLDGAGNPWVDADVGIKDGRIAKVGVIAARGKREIDARNKYVSPGFIDMMDQSGEVLLENGAAENKLRQGVTTVIAGEGGTPVEAAKIPDYFKQLETQGIGVNFGTYYASHQARMQIMGDKAGAPTPAQMAAMEKEVGIAMRAGAFGITSALIYPPSSFQTTEDLIKLAKVASQCNGFYATHMREESSKLIPAIEEAIAIGEKGGVKVEIFHLKNAYAPQWGKGMPKAVALVDSARARGVDIAADMYPYTAGGTGIEITVPNWVWADGVEKGIERLKDPAVRAKLKQQVAAGSMADWSNLVEASGGWDKVVLANPQNPKYEKFNGKSFAEIGAALGIDPADAAWNIVVEAYPKRSMALYFMMSEQDIETALRQPWTSIGSDAGASATPGKVDTLGLPHPRSYGTFPRVIAEYVKRRPVLPLEQAVRKMTGWPAQRMGLSDRGLVRQGMRADVVVFDYAKIDDVASWKNPTDYPTGIDTVIVNGAVAVDQGTLENTKAGAVLRHSCD